MKCNVAADGCTGRHAEFEAAATQAGVAIHYICKCGTKFCQHDQSVANYYADYTGETAWKPNVVSSPVTNRYSPFGKRKASMRLLAINEHHIQSGLGGLHMPNTAMAKLQCKWCDKLVDKRGISQHETACEQNPANRTGAPTDMDIVLEAYERGVRAGIALAKEFRDKPARDTEGGDQSLKMANETAA